MRFNVDGVQIDADVSIGTDATGVVLFVHGSGSGRHSPRNQFVAAKLQERALGTVLMDLLTPEEEHADQFTGHLRFNISFLARRVLSLLGHLRRQTPLPIGLFGASTGSAAALVVAATRPGRDRRHRLARRSPGSRGPCFSDGGGANTAHRRRRRRGGTRAQSKSHGKDDRSGSARDCPRRDAPLSRGGRARNGRGTGGWLVHHTISVEDANETT